MMFRYLLLAACTLSLIGCATTGRQAGAGKKGQHMVIRTTAYTAAEPGGAHAATGERLHFGGDTYSAAADWSWMPLGTRFKMLENGRTYVIEDYGSALVGKKTVDLFMPNNASMRAWGCKNVEIEIQEWGSAAMSLKLLEPRTKNGHVATMVACLHQKGVKAEPAATLLARE